MKMKLKLERSPAHEMKMSIFAVTLTMAKTKNIVVISASSGNCGSKASEI